MSQSATLEHAPHAPEKGWAHRLLGPLHVTGIFWYRFHRWGVSVLPDWGVLLFVAIFTTFFFVALRRIRRAIAANLVAVLGPARWLERQARIYRTMWSFAWCLSERYERLSTRRPFAVEAEGLDIWNAALATGKPILLLTAHVGNFEVGSMLPAVRGERHIHVVREQEGDRRAQAFIERLIRGLDQPGYTVHFENDDPLHGVPLVEVLQGNGVVALQGDRPRAGSRTVSVTLFDRPIPMPAGPAALARATGAIIVPVFVLRVARRRYRACFRPAFSVGQGSDRRRQLVDAVQRFASEAAWAIREEPFQWFCFRTLWPER